MKFKFLISFIFCVIVYDCGYSQKGDLNPLNTASVLVGIEKDSLKELFLMAKIVLVSDNNPKESIYFITNGTYYIFHFDEQDKVKAVIIKLTREKHEIAAQLLIQDSDWEYIEDSEQNNLKGYLNPNYSNLSAVLKVEEEATYFVILPISK